MNEEKLYSFIGLIQKSGNLIAGYNNCISEINKDKCKFVLIADDASDNTKDKFISICENKKILYKVFGDKERIGSSIGKLPRSVLIIKDEKMSKVVLNMFE